MARWIFTLVTFVAFAGLALNAMHADMNFTAIALLIVAIERLLTLIDPDKHDLGAAHR